MLYLFALGAVALRAPAAETSNQLATIRVANEAPVAVSNDELCSLCDLIVSYVDSYITSNPNATEEEIEAELDQVCSYLGPIEDECVAFVAAETPAILEYLEQMPPDQVCGALGVCPNSSSTAASAGPFATPGGVRKPRPAPAESRACGTCMALAGAVSNTARHADTDGEARAAAACALVFPGNEARCREVQSRLARVRPAAPRPMCEAASMCPAVAAPRKVGDGLCALCTMVVAYVQAYLTANPNATTAEIEASLDQVCGFLGPEADMCKSFVSQEVPAIVTWLENAPAANVCAELMACPSAPLSLVDAINGKTQALRFLFRTGAATKSGRAAEVVKSLRLGEL